MSKIVRLANRGVELTKKYGNIAWNDYINKVAKCQANGQTMSRIQLLTLYVKAELGPPSPAQARESIAKFMDLPWSLTRERLMNMTTKEALCKSLLVVDVAIFFAIGEVIGRGDWAGYPIKGASGWEFSNMYTEEDIKKMDAERAKTNQA
ncbi:uncharacterized protein LOC134250442 [Saccostrea cucullata]|uniref:uncharacterized protein LOC134239065 n=1 Tax=Saccostrea cuccullata TaxID=36930 RepID=UPI002ED56581